MEAVSIKLLIAACIVLRNFSNFYKILYSYKLYEIQSDQISIDI